MIDDAGAVANYYLDASALVKLVADDVDEGPGRVELRRRFHGEQLSYSTSYCIAEALSAFKVKWLRGRITQSQYHRDVREFFRLVVSGLTVDEVPLSAQVLNEAERLMAAHSIDFVDAIQVVTVVRGRFAGLVGGSQTVLITADRELARAARAEGCRVWECTTEAAPR